MIYIEIGIVYLPLNINYLRTQRKWTQEQLGELLGCTLGTISNWEKGIRKPDVYELYKLSNIFEVSVDDLVKKDLRKEKRFYTKEEVKEKITNIVDKSELEENKKVTIKTMVSMICEDEK